MDDIEFTVSQRPWLLAWSLVCFAVAVGAAIDLATGADFIRGDVRTAMIVVGVIGGPVLLDVAMGKTVMTASTLTTSSLFHRRSCALNEITRVELRERRGRGYSAGIYVHPVEGTPMKLRAPLSTNERSNDVLEDKIKVIKDRCARVSRHRPR